MIDDADYQAKRNALPPEVQTLVDRARERLEAGDEPAAVRIEFNHQVARLKRDKS